MDNSKVKIGLSELNKIAEYSMVQWDKKIPLNLDPKELQIYLILCGLDTFLSTKKIQTPFEVNNEELYRTKT